jgi:hypothetical protein
MSNTVVELKCSTCEIIFYRSLKNYNQCIKNNQTNFYCCLSCAAKSNNHHIPNNKKDREIKTCPNCNKEIPYNNIYCSNKCQRKYEWIKLTDDVESSGLIPKNAWTARKYMLWKYGNKCSICSNSMWMEQPIPVVVDHINGDPTDRNIKNVRLICCNCDAQTPTYKIKNKGNGRHYRRMRYQNGASY